MNNGDYSLTIDDSNNLIYYPTNNPEQFIMKLSPNGLLTVTNIKLLNNDFLQKITVLE
jgi:hypothetical protein